MRFWRTWVAWIGFGGNQNFESPATDLCGELQALLDLSYYAASQAVAFSRLLEHQIHSLSTTEEDRGIIAQEYSTLQSKLEHLRETISTLHALLNSARGHLVLGSSRSEWEFSNQMIAELLASREVLDLKEALRNLDHKPVGSEP